ncbi:hypothetical protein BDR04DRAFT_1104432 [Suillus decipiens]|nr:hypothetical protein BDR04DRAFT_1104432 [Suillus decipiens]
MSFSDLLRHLSPRSSLRVTFFDPAFSSSESRPTSRSPLDLSSVASLNDLHGTVTAIHASSTFHLFSAEQQAALVRAVAALLSPVPGSIIFGAHVGLPKKGIVQEEMFGGTVDIHCYDPESWNKPWGDAGSFKTEAILKEAIGPNGKMGWRMVWSAMVNLT